MEKIKVYQEAFEVLLNKLKHCGNLMTIEKINKDTGELKIIRTNNIINNIEDCMVEVLEEN
jgi:hypothetical protein